MRRKRIDICGPFLPINDDKRTEELTELRKKVLDCINKALSHE